jgi:AraC family transcriptional regulator
MPAQWGEFAPWLGRVPGQRGSVAYGILYNDTDSGIDYLTGVEVEDFARLPQTLARLRIAPHRYAVFRHSGHVSAISGTWRAIWSDWFPRSGYRAADAPMFERYPGSFDPATGSGGFEIWIPVEPIV